MSDFNNALRVNGGFMNTRSLIQGLVAVLALLCADLVPAQDRSRSSQSNMYVGGAIGRGGYDADFERTKEVVRTTGATTFNVTANATDTMWKGYFGYRVSPHFSMEAGYWNFGRVDLSATITAPAAAALQRNYRAEGFGADAVFWLPVNNSWSGLLKAGAMRTATKANASDPGAGLTALPAESAYKFNPRWGVGLEYRLTSAAAARIEYENVRKVGDDSKFGTADVNMWTIGANYRF